MQAAAKIIPGVALLAAFALSGCGSDSPATANTVAKIDFKSNEIAGTVIPTAYTCDGKDISPPFEWSAVPADTSELTLFVVGFIPEPKTKSYKISVEWAVAGLSPTLRRLLPGRLPPGAHLGIDSDGKRKPYSICPKKGTNIQYRFEMYGVPAGKIVSHNFHGFQTLVSLTNPKSATRTNAFGGFAATYKRA